MALLVLLGCLCNVLLAWATLQQLYLSKTLSLPPPRNPNKWTHSIIFEPQLQIQNYLNQLWIDIQDPYHFQYLTLPIIQVPIDLTINNSHIDTF